MIRPSRIFHFIRYDFLAGIRNLMTFFLVVWSFRNFDYAYSLKLFQVGLIQLHNCLEHGIEVDEYRIPKVKRIEQALQIIANITEDNYLQMAEEHLGELIVDENPWIPIDDDYVEYSPNFTEDEEAHNKGIYDLSRFLEETEWKQLKKILFGSGNKPDGTDMRGWWD